MSLDPLLPLDMIGIKKVTGGALEVGVDVFFHMHYYRVESPIHT